MRAERQPAALPGQWALWLQASSCEECASEYNTPVSFLRGLLGTFFHCSYFQTDPVLNFTSFWQSQLRTSCRWRSEFWTSFEFPLRYHLFYCSPLGPRGKDDFQTEITSKVEFLFFTELKHEFIRSCLWQEELLHISFVSGVGDISSVCLQFLDCRFLKVTRVEVTFGHGQVQVSGISYHVAKTTDDLLEFSGLANKQLSLQYMLIWLGVPRHGTKTNIYKHKSRGNGLNQASACCWVYLLYQDL